MMDGPLQPICSQTAHVGHCGPDTCAVCCGFRSDVIAAFEVRYYLFSLIMNLTRDLYEIKLLMETERSSKRSSSQLAAENGVVSHGSPSPPQILEFRLRLLLHVLRNNPPLLLDLAKNTFDLFIPLDRLGLYKTNPGFVGLCGLTSSILSILSIVHPWLKLKP